MLNHDPTGPMYEHGERMHLNRLKLAIKLRQKKVSLTQRFLVKSIENLTTFILFKQIALKFLKLRKYC